MQTYTVHTDIVARRFIRVGEQAYFLAAYGDAKECIAIENLPIGPLKETTLQVRFKMDKKPSWTAVEPSKEVVNEETFRRVSNEHFKNNWRRTLDLYPRDL